MIELEQEYVYAVVTPEGERLTKFYDSISPAKAWLTKKNTVRDLFNKEPLNAEPVKYLVSPANKVST